MIPRRSAGDDLRNVSTEFTDVLVCGICSNHPARPIWIDESMIVAVCSRHDSFWWWDYAHAKTARAIRRAAQMP